MSYSLSVSLSLLPAAPQLTDIARALYKHKLKLEAKQAERDAHAAEARAERTRSLAMITIDQHNKNDKHRR